LTVDPIAISGYHKKVDYKDDVVYCRKFSHLLYSFIDTKRRPVTSSCGGKPWLGNFFNRSYSSFQLSWVSNPVNVVFSSLATYSSPAIRAKSSRYSGVKLKL